MTHQCCNCGAGHPPGASSCAKCGSAFSDSLPATPQASVPAPASTPVRTASPLPERWRRSAPLAFLMSLVIPGLGQVYAGHVFRALAFFLASLLSWTWVLTWAVHLAAAFEAYFAARESARRFAS